MGRSSNPETGGPASAPALRAPTNPAAASPAAVRLTNPRRSVAINPSVELSARLPLCPSARLPRLLVSQRLDRVHPGGPIRRVEAEPEADPDRDQHGDDRAPDRRPRFDREAELEQLADPEADGDADQAPDQGQRCRLDQELPENLAPGGAECLPGA